MFRPHIVNHVTDTKTGAKTYIEPKPRKTLPWKQEHIDVIKHALVGVNVEGTGARAFKDAGYVAAGKTGTAQMFSYKGAEHKTETMAAHLRDHALYVAFAPADAPKIALAVLVENGGFGAQAAAPIARQVFDYYLLGKVPPGAAPADEAAVEADE
jgi:penicillin-binding protein 2